MMTMDVTAGPAGDGPGLPARLSQVLTAFIIECDNEFEHRMPHRTTRTGSAGGLAHPPWLVSMAMWANCLRFVPAGGITAGELAGQARLTGASMQLVRTPLSKWWGYLAVARGAAGPGGRGAAGGRGAGALAGAVRAGRDRRPAGRAGAGGRGAGRPAARLPPGRGAGPGPGRGGRRRAGPAGPAVQGAAGPGPGLRAALGAGPGDLHRPRPGPARAQ